MSNSFVTPWTVARQSPPSMGFPRQGYWSGLPFPSPMCESEVVQLCPTVSNPVHCSPPGSSVQGIFQARALEWDAIAFSASKEQASFNFMALVPICSDFGKEKREMAEPCGGFCSRVEYNTLTHAALTKASHVDKLAINRAESIISVQGQTSWEGWGIYGPKIQSTMAFWRW